MLRNYLKIAFRSIRRYPGYSLINIGGLGLGLACTFLIVLFIRHELSNDRQPGRKSALRMTGMRVHGWA